jgi:hypothetical protein
MSVVFAWYSLLLGSTTPLYSADHHGVLFDVVRYCKSLSKSRYYEFVRSLGRSRELATLLRIMESDLDERSYAATVYALKSPSDKVVAFCKRFPVESDNWTSAFYVLGYHEKSAVIRYIKQVGASKSPRVRALCYKICTKARWGDLVHLAERDKADKTQLPEFGIGETLGRIARSYVENEKGPRKGAR